MYAYSNHLLVLLCFVGNEFFLTFLNKSYGLIQLAVSLTEAFHASPFFFTVPPRQSRLTSASTFDHQTLSQRQLALQALLDQTSELYPSVITGEKSKEINTTHVGIDDVVNELKKLEEIEKSSKVYLAIDLSLFIVRLVICG